MNQDIKLLVESIFDDNADLFNSEDDMVNIISQNLYDNVMSKIQKYIDDIVLNPNTINGNYMMKYKLEHSKDNRIYIDKDPDNLYFYMIDKEGSRFYIEDMTFVSYNTDIDWFIDKMQNLFDEISKLNIENVCCGININSRSNATANNIIDFHHLNFFKVTITGITPVNLVINDTRTKSILEKNKKPYYNNPYYDSNPFHLFISSNINNLIIEDVDNIRINDCYINNFSNFKNINGTFEFNSHYPKTLPACHSFEGLPDKDYTVSIKIYDGQYYTSERELYKQIECHGQKLLTLKGLPENAKQINIDIQASPYYFLRFFSFEGLTEQMLEHFEFNQHGFHGRASQGYIQLGAYEIPINFRRWHPSKPQYKYIITSKNWFLDAYEKTPNIIYDESKLNIDVSTGLSDKIKKQQEERTQKQQDAADDLQEMTDNLLNFIKVKMTLISSYYSSAYLIQKITDKRIYFYKYSGVNRGYNYSCSFKDFLNIISKSHLYYNSPDGTKIYLKDIIIDPVKEKREKINTRRKQAEKRKKEKEKLERIIKKEQEKAAKQKTQPQVQQTTADNIEQEIETKLNIKVVDYSEYALAVFGNTYNIKDKLKELSAKYNPRLKYDNDVKPGWIISKKKKEQLLQILQELL